MGYWMLLMKLLNWLSVAKIGHQDIETDIPDSIVATIQQDNFIAEYNLKSKNHLVGTARTVQR